MRHTAEWISAALIVCCFGLSELPAAPASDAPEVSFERDVRPLLKAHCFHCHGEQGRTEAGLDLRLRRFVANGGDSGPAIVPGKPDKSLLIERVAAGEMPPGKVEKLSPEQIDVIRRWIAAGSPTLYDEPAELTSDFLITPEDRAFWSFQPIRRPEVPAVQHPERIATPVDNFVLARLEANDLTFTPDADRRTLIRRLTFDLTGLPPTPEEVEAFVADPAPDAYQQLVERLLASPQYGERWGRHWLDVAGYADSEGYTTADAERKWAWKYRDYVIRAFNDDKPFNEFVVEQLAGDELISPPYTNLTPEAAEKLIATGFLRMAPDGTGSGADDPNLARNEVIAETIKIVSGAFVGLTVGCAQCHHHRYDPISQDDYHAMRAIFEPAYDWKNWRTPQQRLISLYTEEDREKAAEIEAKAKEVEQLRSKKQAELVEATFERELAKVPEEIRETVREARNTPVKNRTPEQQALLKKYPSVNVTAGSLSLFDPKAAAELQKFTKEAADIRATKPAEEFIRALTEVPGKIPKSFLFARGDHEQPKQEIVPAALTILSGEQSQRFPEDDPALPTSGRRLAFARWLTSDDHPLTARVIANRVWLHHFGRGLVITPGDFGILGEAPTHPELLDWLASELRENGWSIKHLHRLIVNSTTYRQSLRTDEKYFTLDPDNKLYGGRDPRRLEAEAIRDGILRVSGKLNLKPFGPPIPVMADRVGQWVIGIENLNAGRPGPVIPMNGEEFRRSVYVQVRRSRPLAVLDTFDLPLMEPNCEARSSSTVAPQSLMLMNSDFIVEQSEHFAERVHAEAGADLQAQAVQAWRLAFLRPPTESEITTALTFLADQTEAFRQRLGSAAADKKKDDKRTPEQYALASLCQILLSSNEFLYVD